MAVRIWSELRVLSVAGRSSASSQSPSTLQGRSETESRFHGHSEATLVQLLLELHKRSGSAPTFPQAPSQSWPWLLHLSQVRVSYRGMQGLHSSTGYATNHTQTKSHRKNTEEEACRARAERTPSHGRPDAFLWWWEPFGGRNPPAGACSKSISRYRRLVQRHGDY